MMKRIITIAAAAAVVAALTFAVKTDPAYAQIAGKSTQMYTYEEMEKDLKEIAGEYPQLTELTSLGTTIDGRRIYCLRIGPADARKKVLFNASIHAREYITTESLMLQTYEYLDNIRNKVSYKGRSYADMANDTAVYVVPMINPDGVTISQLGMDGLRYQSTRAGIYKIYELDRAVELAPYLRSWKSNAEGIDVNRQFDALWEKYNDRVGHPSSDHYKGTAPATTAEAKAMIELTEKTGFDRTVSYHTQGQVVYWYFGQEGKLYDDTKALAEAIGNVTGYKLDANYQNLDPAGYKDWAISKKGIPSLTIEVGTGGNPVDHAQLSEIVKQNRYVFAETILSMD